MLSYRLAQFWFPILFGGALYATLRVGPWSMRRRERLKRLRELAAESTSNHDTTLDFAARFGRRVGGPPSPSSAAPRKVEGPPHWPSASPDEPAPRWPAKGADDDQP